MRLGWGGRSEGGKGGKGEELDCYGIMLLRLVGGNCYVTLRSWHDGPRAFAWAEA